MSRLDPPTVLLDASFVAALISHDEPFHTEAIAAYADLLNRYERAEVLLGATSDTLEALPAAIRRSLFAPVAAVRIAEQHRNAAIDVAGPSAADPDLATMLVILRRERIRMVASFDRRLDRFNLEIIPQPAGQQSPESLVDANDAHENAAVHVEGDADNVVNGNSDAVHGPDSQTSADGPEPAH